VQYDRVMNADSDQPLKLFNKTSAIAGAVALSYANRRYKQAMRMIAECLGERLREVLPAEEYRVEVNGPILDVKGTRGNSATGILGLHLLERGTPEEKLTRVFESAGGSFRNMVAAGEPHVIVTDEAIDLWWGSAEPERASVRLRPIPRSQLGL
jgi:hypothetical protein